MVERQENVLAGAVGAFLFSLAGGILWYLLYQVGFIAGITGIVGVICAFKGYEIFAKGMSKKGIIISVVMAMIVIIIAWYLCMAGVVYNDFKDAYELGEIDYELTYVESVISAWICLTEPELAFYFVRDLLIGLVFCVIGIVPQVKAMAAKTKLAETQAAGAPEADFAPDMQISGLENTQQDENSSNDTQ